MTGKLNNIPSVKVEVVEQGSPKKRGWERCELGTDIDFNTSGLESYFFSKWSPDVYDAMVVAGAVEYCDRLRRRPTNGWLREIQLTSHR
jgi:hypothetical protein